ncbi:MAG: hypothetical protein K5694_03470 [Bacilli bacterium]|nr:hypothetical protein [Bacilli bacterium]
MFESFKKFFKKEEVAETEPTDRNAVFGNKRGIDKEASISSLVKVNLGKGSYIAPGVRIFGKGQITIGENSIVQENAVIYVSENGGITIGDDCVIGPNVMIVDHENNPTKRDIKNNAMKLTSKPIVLGNDVFVGHSSIIHLGVNLAEGCYVKENSEVFTSFYAYTIIEGKPAKKTNIRF